jgi:ornithine decarboxylase
MPLRQPARGGSERLSSDWALEDFAIGTGPRALVEQHGSPLLVLDCDQLRSRYRRLAAALQGVEINYAMKALPHPAAIATLRDEGACFDVSSSGEIKVLREVGVPPSRAIHTHPVKRTKDILDSLEYGCTTFVVDNPSEMEKFVSFRDRVALLLRIGFHSADAVFDLSKKFGCALEEVGDLFKHAKKLRLPLRGLSFHVGSQCRSPKAHVEAIETCRGLIEQAARDQLADLTILDIGGGFPSTYLEEMPEIEAFCSPIRAALAWAPPGMRKFAEPGRYLAAAAMAGIATVIGKAWRRQSFWYYLDDGVYGSFSGMTYEAARYPFQVVGARPGPSYPSVLAGPTCDSVDIVADHLTLPELQIGDLIVGSVMGAYTSASASEFNSIPRTKIVVLNGPSVASRQS